METTNEAGGLAGAEVGTLDSQPTAEPAEEPVGEIALVTLLDDNGSFRTVQVREKVNQSAVDAYATTMQGGDAGKFPPIIVYEVTDRDNVPYLAAGLHRCSAARLAGLTHLRGRIRRAPWHAALEAAIKTNATHGHRPTFGDVCETLLQMHDDPEYRKLSNVRKAEFIGVSEGTIRSAKRRLEADSKLTSEDTIEVRRSDGTTQRRPARLKSHSQLASEVSDGDDDIALPRQAPFDGEAAARLMHEIADKTESAIKAVRDAGLDPNGVSDEDLTMLQHSTVHQGLPAEAMRSTVAFLSRLLERLPQTACLGTQTTGKAA